MRVGTQTANVLERYIVFGDREGLIDPQIKENAGGPIKQFLSVHEDNVAALPRIELRHKPASRRFHNLAGRDQEQAVQQDIVIRFRIEDRMIDGHTRFVEHARHALCPARVI